jgi:hypothetical protein
MPPPDAVTRPVGAPRVLPLGMVCDTKNGLSFWDLAWPMRAVALVKVLLEAMSGAIMLPTDQKVGVRIPRGAPLTCRNGHAAWPVSHRSLWSPAFRAISHATRGWSNPSGQDLFAPITLFSSGRLDYRWLASRRRQSRVTVVRKVGHRTWRQSGCATARPCRHGGQAPQSRRRGGRLSVMAISTRVALVLQLSGGARKMLPLVRARASQILSAAR